MNSSISKAVGSVFVGLSLFVPATISAQSFFPVDPSGGGGYDFPDAIDPIAAFGAADISAGGFKAFTGPASPLGGRIVGGGFGNPYGFAYSSLGYGYYGPYRSNYDVRYNNYLRSVNYANQLYAYQYQRYRQAYYPYYAGNYSAIWNPYAYGGLGGGVLWLLQ
jgi:hypothetical protein